MTATTRWAVLGPGEISGFFAAALPHSRSGVLRAVASRDRSRAEALARRYEAPTGAPCVVGTYDEVLARDDVDAVYIGTVHTTHAELAIAALRAGKAVLCEKPVATSLRETRAVIDAARASGMPFVEAFKYRFGPFADRARELVASGGLGRIVRVEASFGFAASARGGRLFDPATGGGAILDAGCYPVSLAVAAAAWSGADLDDIAVHSADGSIGVSGVDETARADLAWADARATVGTSIVADLPRGARIVGTEATLDVSNVWGSRTESVPGALVRSPMGDRSIDAPVVDPFAAEADAVSDALAEGRGEAPQMTWRESLAVARLLAQWRALLADG